MAKKVILKDDNVEIMPITRGELVLDSSGQQAFHSSQFLATQSQPGLMSGEDKTKLDSLEKVTVEDKKVEQVNTTTNNSSYRVLFSNSADDTTKTEGTRKSAKLLFNPSTGALTATALIGKLDWSNLNDVPETFTPAQHIHNTSEITALTSYSKASSASDLVTTDTLNVALGKLEYKADTAYDWIISVTTADTDKYINKWQEILDFLNAVDNTDGADITDEFVTRKSDQEVIGKKTFSTQQKFTVAQGTSPFIVSSTTKVDNLNADLLDGQHGNWYLNNVIAFSRFNYTGTNQHDANVGTSGMLYNYGSDTYWRNTPSNMLYGQILTLRSGNTLDLAGQLAWDINHNSTTDTTRYLWWRATDDGTFTEAKWHRIAYADDIPTKTSQLTNDSGFLTSRGYIGTTAVQASSAVQTLTGISRISNSTSAALYLGNSGNQSWVMTQDICSHSGSGSWAINIAGTAWFKNVNIGYTYNATSGYNLGVTGTGYISSTLTIGAKVSSRKATWLKLKTPGHTGSDAWCIMVDDTTDYSIIQFGYTASTPIFHFRTDGALIATHFYESSDAVLKTNIQDIIKADKIPTIRQFDWKSDGSHSYGLIAQELEEMGYSELVDSSGEHKTVKYSAALSLIVGKLQVKIKELEKEIEELKNK